MVGSHRHVNGFFGVRRKRRMTINPAGVTINPAGVTINPAGVTINPAGVTINPALCIVNEPEKSEEKKEK